MWQQFKALNISTFRWNIHTTVFKIRKQKILQGKLMTIWYDLALVTGSRLLFEVRQAGSLSSLDWQKSGWEIKLLHEHKELIHEAKANSDLKKLTSLWHGPYKSLIRKKRKKSFWRSWGVCSWGSRIITSILPCPHSWVFNLYLGNKSQWTALSSDIRGFKLEDLMD